jgi:hypothetical protein
MTQAFNLAQLANNLNTSGQLDGTDGLTGLVANANLASSGSPSSSTYLRGDRTWSALPALGKVLQVVNTIKSDTFITTSSSFVDVPGLTVNITPSSASSKILVITTISYGGGQNSYGFGQLVRNGTPIALGNGDGGSRTECTFSINIENTGSGAAKTQCAGMTVLDSPATTSAITYKIQIVSGYTSTAASINRSGDNSNETFSGLGVSTITVMEISA